MRKVVKKIFFASQNKNKIIEVKKLFQPLNIMVVSAIDLNILAPEETGTTFEENALLKANFYANYTNMPVIADDSGLVVAALNGAPGVYSARWAGLDGNFVNAINKLENLLINKSNRQAYFECVLALINLDFRSQIFNGKWYGELTFPPRGNYGFGYDPIFIPTGFNITAAEMLPEQKNLLSHRAVAFNNLINYLNQHQS